MWVPRRLGLHSPCCGPSFTVLRGEPDSPWPPAQDGHGRAEFHTQGLTRASAASPDRDARPLAALLGVRDRRLQTGPWKKGRAGARPRM